MGSSVIQFLTARKRKTKVLILGDYSKSENIGAPDDICERKLRLVQSFLKNNGFFESFLVMDFIDEHIVPNEAMDEHFLQKSQYYIQNWADILVFILLKEGDHQSVIREWSFLVLECPQKTRNSILVCHEEVSLRALIRGDLKSFRVAYDTFNDDNLCLKTYNQVFIKLYSLLG